MEFLSTPSARRATALETMQISSVTISIHALREEGDQRSKRGRVLQNNFYPRPPRGGRPGGKMPSEKDMSISIHALREEGDGKQSGRCHQQHYFYPRPPRGGRPRPQGRRPADQPISIHALREEGDPAGR